MAERQKLQYLDYRPIKGDKARHYYSARLQKTITLREFQTLARGESYERYAKRRKILYGEEKKQYRKRRTAEERELEKKRKQEEREQKKLERIREKAKKIKVLPIDKKDKNRFKKRFKYAQAKYLQFYPQYADDFKKGKFNKEFLEMYNYMLHHDPGDERYDYYVSHYEMEDMYEYWKEGDTP